ncbi:MAG: helix-turn-helix domain-containing protein [Solirubrobacterales bacterium]
MAAKRKRTSKAKQKKSLALELNLIKALAHEMRVEIFGILNERVASPNELAKELGEGLSQVSYHVKVLKDYGCIKLVKTEPRRGAVEHYYRATAGAFLAGRVDKKGLKELNDLVERTQKQVEAIQARGSARLEKSGGTGTTAAVILLGLELPEARGSKPKASKKSSAKRSSSTKKRK